MNEAYRKKITELVENSQDEEYLKAVYSFAANFPDNTPGRNASGN